jgi:hypothetical protein
MRDINILRFSGLIAVVAAASLAAPSFAASNNGKGSGGSAGNPKQPVACGLNDLSLAALSCSGFYSGNLLNNNDIVAQTAGLQAIGYSWDGDFTSLVNAGQKIEGNGATQISFGTPLSGITVLGIHFGGGGANGVGNGTAFYRFDAGSITDSIGLNYPGSSGIVLYSTGHAVVPSPGSGDGGNDGGAAPVVPEPLTWVMMIAGFGMVGYTLRRQKRVVSLG